MARQEIPIGTVQGSFSTSIQWGNIRVNNRINAALVSGGRTAFLRTFGISTGSSQVRLLTATTATGATGGAGPDLTDAWEGSAVAVTIKAGSWERTIPGPTNAGTRVQDTAEPYNWLPAQPDPRLEIITSYNVLSSSDKANTVLILDDGESEGYPAGYWAELRRSSSHSSLIEDANGIQLWLVTSDGLPLEQERQPSSSAAWVPQTSDTDEPDWVGNILGNNISFRFRKSGKAWLPDNNGIDITTNTGSIPWNGGSRYRFFEQASATTETQTFYRRGTTAPSAPADTVTTGTPTGWSTSNPGATSTDNVYSVVRTQTLTAGTVTSASYGTVTKVADATGPVITTNVETFYRLGSTAPTAPTANTGTPAGWLTSEPTATLTENVYSVTRTQTLTDGVVTSAVYGSVTKIADKGLVHTFSITSVGGGYNGVGNRGSIAAGSSDTYTTPAGKSVRVRHCRFVASNSELNFAITPGSNGDADWPVRIVATKTTGGEVSMEMTQQAGSRRNLSGDLWRQDYNRSAGAQFNQVFVDNQTVRIELYYEGGSELPVTVEFPGNASSISLNLTKRAGRKLPVQASLPGNASSLSINLTVKEGVGLPVQVDFPGVASTLGTSLSIRTSKRIEVAFPSNPSSMSVNLGKRAGRKLPIQATFPGNASFLETDLTIFSGSSVAIQVEFPGTSSNLSVSLGKGGRTEQIGVDFPGNSSSLSVRASVRSATRRDIIASGQAIREGLNVTLDGRNSVGVTEYIWTQISGPPVTIENADTARANFRIPARANVSFSPTTGKFNIGDRGRVQILDEGIDGVYKIQERVDNLEGTIALSLIRDLDEAYITDEDRLGLIPTDYISVFTPQEVSGIIFTEEILPNGSIEVTLYWTNPSRNDGTHIRALINGTLITETTVRGNNFTWPGRTKGDKLEVELYGVLDDTISELAVKATHIVGTGTTVISPNKIRPPVITYFNNYLTIELDVLPNTNLLDIRFSPGFSRDDNFDALVQLGTSSVPLFIGGVQRQVITVPAWYIDDADQQVLLAGTNRIYIKPSGPGGDGPIVSGLVTIIRTGGINETLIQNRWEGDLENLVKFPDGIFDILVPASSKQADQVTWAEWTATDPETVFLDRVTTGDARYTTPDNIIDSHDKYRSHEFHLLADIQDFLSNAVSENYTWRIDYTRPDETTGTTGDINGMTDSVLVDSAIQRWTATVSIDLSDTTKSWFFSNLNITVSHREDPGAGIPGIEFIYARTADETPPSLPDNTWGFDQPQSPWHDAAPGITPELPFLWISSRKTSGTPEVGAPVEDTWTAPAIIGRYGVEGEAGEDGEGIEFIYAITAEGSRPSDPDNAWGYDQPQSPWNDGAPSTSEAFPLLWVSTRKVLGAPAVGDEVADNWRTPTILSRYGIDGQAGEDGAPGRDGVRGPAVFRVPVNSAQQGLLEQTQNFVRLTTSSLITLANTATEGANVYGDFVFFYRGNFARAFFWSRGDYWQAAEKFIGAEQIAAVNIDAVQGNFSDLNVEGELSANKITGDVQNTTIFKKYSSPLELRRNNTVTVDLGSDIDIRDYDAITGIADVRINNADRIPFAIDVPALAVGGADYSPSVRTTRSIALLTSSAGSATTRVFMWRSSDGRYIYFRDRDDNAEIHIIMGIKYPGSSESGGGSSGGTPSTTTNTDTFYRRGTSEPSAPNANTGTPSGWSATDPGPTQTENVYQVTRTQTLTNGIVSSATYSSVTLRTSRTGGGGSTITTNEEDFFKRGTSEPSAPTDQTGTPTGWLSGNPGATETENVYRVTRTQTLTDGTVTNAVYGAVTKIADATGTALASAPSSVAITLGVASGSGIERGRSVTIGVSPQTPSGYTLQIQTRVRGIDNVWTQWGSSWNSAVSTIQTGLQARARFRRTSDGQTTSYTTSSIVDP